MRKGFGIALSILLASRSAVANGRFPQAQIIESVPGGDGTKLFMRTTFGILTSEDAGKSWRWICERALGYEGRWDPSIAVTRDGRLWVGLDHGLASTVDGCVVETAPELEGETVKDLTIDGKGDTLFAITGAVGKTSAVWRKKPGAKWERLGSKGLETLNLLTIEVAPGRPQRVYVAGEPYDTPRGRLYRSDDGGQTFEGKPNDEKPNGPFFIAAVDPADPDRVLLRHLHEQGSELLLTKDAGKTFTNVLSMKSAMFGFAKSPDGKTYWAASGLAEDGLFRSTDRGETFANVAKHGVLCLHAASGSRLFSCENPFKTGAPVVGLSTDQGATHVSLGGFDRVLGPISCGGAASTMCAATWNETEAFIFPRTSPDASAPASDAGRPRGPDASPPRKSACGCSLPGGRTLLDPASLISGLAPLLLWARSRGRRGSRVGHGGRA